MDTVLLRVVINWKSYTKYYNLEWLFVNNIAKDFWLKKWDVYSCKINWYPCSKGRKISKKDKVLRFDRLICSKCWKSSVTCCPRKIPLTR